MIYIFLALIAGWVSFYSRPLKVDVAFELQQTVWLGLKEKGKASASDDLLAKIHSSRILFPAVMQIPMKFGVPGEKSFSLVRLLSIMAAYVLFHLYLRLWFPAHFAFCGTLFLAATVPLTFNSYFEIPSDFIEIIIFTLGLWTMYKGKYGWFCLIVLIGTLNRESTAVLPFLLFLHLFTVRKISWLLPVFESALCWLVPLVALRWWTGALDTYGYWQSASHNVAGLSQLLVNPHPYNNYLFWFYLFGAFWFLPFIKWHQQPVFFRRLLIGMPAILVTYFLTAGALDEPRQIVNLYPLLVPPGLVALFAESLTCQGARAEIARGHDEGRVAML